MARGGAPAAARSATAANPWEVLVAEVMSQQTGIERVGPAWRRFVDRWPTPADLAEAGTHELLAAWAGLGYNRRALALREAARTIVADHDGRVPATVAALEALPGIGPYTARAVAASAFGIPVAPLDVNVRRVVCRGARRAGGRRPVSRPRQMVWSSRRRSRQWLDAVMDLASGDVHERAPRLRSLPARDSLCASREAVVSRGAEGPPRCRSPDDQLAPRPSRRGRDRAPVGTGCVCPSASATMTATRSGRPARDSNARGSWTSCGRGSGARVTQRQPAVGRTARSVLLIGDARPHRRAAQGTPADALTSGYASRAMAPAAQPTTPDAAPPLPADDPSIFEMDLRGLRRHWAAQAGLPPISAETMTGADRRAQALGYPELRLMEHAGTAVAAAVRALASDLGRWGERPDRRPVRPRQQRRRRLRGRSTARAWPAHR